MVFDLAISSDFQKVKPHTRYDIFVYLPILIKRLCLFIIISLSIRLSRSAVLHSSGGRTSNADESASVNSLNLPDISGSVQPKLMTTLTTQARLPLLLSASAMRSYLPAVAEQLFVDIKKTYEENSQSKTLQY